MKFNKINIVLFAIILLSAMTLGSSARSQMTQNTNSARKDALRNLAKIFASKIIEKLESNINFENEVIQEIQNKNLQKVVTKVSRTVAKNVARTTRVTKIIRASIQGKVIDIKNIPERSIQKVQKVIVKNLTNDKINKVLSIVERRTGTLDEQLKMRIIYAIREAFEDVYLNNPSAIFEEIKRSIPAIAPPTDLKRESKRLIPNNILHHAKQIGKIQINQAQINSQKINQAQKQIKKAEIKVDVGKIIKKAIPESEKKNIKKIINKIDKIRKIENLIQKEIVKPNRTVGQIRKLIKTLHQAKKVEKILENKKNEKISKQIIKTVNNSINTAKQLKNKLLITKDNKLKQQIKKQIVKEIKKAKALIKIEKQINKIVIKNSIESRKLDTQIKKDNKAIQKLNHLKKVVKPNQTKINAAQKVKTLVAKIEKKLVNSNCNPVGVKVLLRTLKKETAKVVHKLQNKNGKNVQKVATNKSASLDKKIKKIQKVLPKVLTSFDIKSVAQKINSNLINTKSIPAKKIEKISESISKKIINNSVFLGTAKKLATQLIVKADISNSSKDGKKLIKKIAEKILAKISAKQNKLVPTKKVLTPLAVAQIQNKIPCNITPKKAEKVAIQLKKVLSNKKGVTSANAEKISQKIAKKIIQSAVNTKAAQKVARVLLNKILKDKKATKDSKKIAAKVAQVVLNLSKKNIQKASISKKINQKAAIITKVIPNKLTVKKAAIVAKKIEKNVIKIQKKATDAQIKKISSKIADKIIKSSTSVKAAKKVVASLIKKIIKNSKASTAAKKTVSEIATKVIRKLSNIKKKN